MTSTTRPRPALIEPDAAARPTTDPRPAWLRGSSDKTVAAFAAAQGWVLSVLAVVLPALAAALTAAEPGDRPGWGASGFGLRVWLAGHGVPQTAGSMVVSLVPLGVTALAVYTVSATTRRAQVVSSSGIVAGTICYTALTVVAALAVGTGGPGVLRAVVGGIVVGAAGTGLGVRSGLVRGTAPATLVPGRAAALVGRVPAPVLAGLRSALLVGALLVVVVSVVVVVWVLAGRGSIAEVVRALSMDTVGALVYAAAQLLYLPNLMVWALAWLSGAGFAVGSGTHFAPDEMVGGPMPAVPLLGALPTWSFPGHLALVAPGVLVVVGVLVGFYLHRRAPDRLWWHQLAAVGTCAATTAAGVAVLVSAASGSVGSGRLSVVGAVWWQVGPLVGGLVALGAVLVVVPGSVALRRAVLAGVRTKVLSRRRQGRHR
ncbi:MAG: DUF6350 family protein [Micrococcales bacterium]|nr:DUF6350 family protein [Micrococcales bacterium]MCL2667069.1 DUF6350 family protein [Micrococcales bacterium]